jgi:Flp pilus assembly protein TadG
MNGLMKHSRSGVDRQDGAATVLLLVLTPALLGLAGLVLDGGTALAARQRSADLAEQAARAGADRLDTDALRSQAGTESAPLDPSAAQAAACGYVHTVEPAASCTATVLPGSNGRPSQQVQVRIRTSTPTILLGVIGVNTLHTDATATATALTGIRTAALTVPTEGIKASILRGKERLR